MMLTVVIFSVSGLLMGILNAHQVFTLPALALSMNNIGLIFGAVVLAPALPPISGPGQANGANIYGLALGAGTSDVVRMVVVEGMTPAAIGIAVGSAAALAAGTLMRKLVFGVSPSDPVTLAVVAGTLALVALVASLVPAYRASRLDPLKVLRAE